MTKEITLRYRPIRGVSNWITEIIREDIKYDEFLTCKARSLTNNFGRLLCVQKKLLSINMTKRKKSPSCLLWTKYLCPAKSMC